MLLVVGYCMAYVIDPLLGALQKRKISRGVGVFAVFGVVLIVLLLLIVTALPTILREYGKLSSNFAVYLETAKTKALELFASVKEYLPSTTIDSSSSSFLDYLPSVGGDVLQKTVSGLTGALLQGYSITLTLVNLLLLPFIVYYLAIDFQDLHSAILKIFPPTLRKTVSRLALEIDGYVSAFVRGQFVVCCILALLYSIGLGLVGIELWFLLAVVSGFGNMIPYLGCLVGIILSSIMALVTFGDFTHLLMVWGVFGVVQFLEGTFITPKIVGDKVGLSPLAVILALFIGGQLFGLLGIFLAIPMAAALRVLMRHTHAVLLKNA